MSKELNGLMAKLKKRSKTDYDKKSELKSKFRKERGCYSCSITYCIPRCKDCPDKLIREFHNL